MDRKFKILSIGKQKNTYAGSTQVPMSSSYLVKTVCRAKALSLILEGKVKKMTELAIAQEIYAHACCYYGSAIVKALGVDNSMVNDIYSRANPVDIDDGGDTAARVTAYILIWTLSPSI